MYNRPLAVGVDITFCAQSLVVLVSSSRGVIAVITRRGDKTCVLSEKRRSDWLAMI